MTTVIFLEMAFAETTQGSHKIKTQDKTQRQEIGRDPKTAIPDCGESEEVSGTPSSNEPKVFRIFSLNVENLVTKISEPDFVSYVKSFVYKHSL